MNKPWFKSAIIILIVLLSLSACQSFSDDASTTENQKITVQLLPFISYSPLFIAAEEGYFDEQGLDVEFTRIFTSEAIVGLIKGDLDVMSTFLSPGMFNTFAENVDIRIVGGKGFVDPNSCTTNGMLGRKQLMEEGQFDDLNNLKGMTIGVDRFSIEYFFMTELLRSSDISIEDMQFVGLDPASEMEALRNGSLDISLASEPWVTRTLNDGQGVLVKDYKDVIPEFQFSVIVFGPSILRDAPELGEKFMAGYVKALQQLAEGKTERNLELLSEFAELDTSFLEEVCWPSYHIDGSINVDSVLEFQEWLVNEGVVDEVMTAEQFWDPSYIE